MAATCRNGDGGARVEETQLCRACYDAVLTPIVDEYSSPAKRTPPRCLKRECRQFRVAGSVFCKRHRDGRAAPAKLPSRGTIKRPRSERALVAARAVWASDDGLTRAEVAQAAGVSPGALQRVVVYAREAGWVVAKRGPNGGYTRGPVAPPAEAVAA